MKTPLLFALAALMAAPAVAQSVARTSAPATFTIESHAARQTAGVVSLLIQDLEQNYRTGTWRDTVRTTNSRFNAFNLPARILRETSANGTTFSPVRRNHRQFDTQGRIVTDTTYSFNVTTGAATPRFSSAKTYNAAGNITQAVLRWQLGTTWQAYGRDTYTYDSNGYLTQLLLEGYAGGSYYPSSRTLYTNDAQGRPTFIEDQQDNGTGTGWLPSATDSYTYNATGQVLVNVSRNVPFQGTAYQNFRRETYTYDPNNPTRVTRTAVDIWNNPASTWNLVGQNLWTYDADGNVVTLLTQQAATPTTYTNYYRHLYTYQRVLATAQARLNAGLTLAPNPAPAGTAALLRYTLPTAAPVAVQVLDALGRVVRTVAAGPQAATAQELALPTAGLAPGLYAVVLSAGNARQTMKLVVE